MVAGEKKQPGTLSEWMDSKPVSDNAFLVDKSITSDIKSKGSYLKNEQGFLRLQGFRPQRIAGFRPSGFDSGGPKCPKDTGKFL